MAKRIMDEGHEETEDVLREIEKRINREYAQAERKIQTKLDDYLRRFETKDRIWQAWVADGAKTEAEYRQWRIGQIMIGRRWAEMRDSLAQDLVNAAALAKSAAFEHMPDVYAINHNYGTFQVEKASLVDTSYTLYDRHTVERLIRDDQIEIFHAPGRRVTEAINTGKQEAWDKKQVTSVMTQAILQGESIPKMATRLSNAVGDGDRKASIRNARTMTTGVQNAGRIDSYKRAENMGIRMKKQWLATLDSRTRHWHRDLDGVAVDTGEPFENDIGKIMFPGDPSADAGNIYNCRCTMIASLAGFERDLSDLRYRNTNHMEEETYEEWKKGHGVSEPITRQEEIGEAMRELYNREYRNTSLFGTENDVDAMAKAERIQIDTTKDSSNVKIYPRNKENIWVETNSEKSQVMTESLERIFSENEYKTPSRTVIAKHETLGGLSAYDNKRDILFIAEELSDSDWLKQNVGEYFAAESLDDVIKHELGGHRAHWEAVRRYFLDNSDRLDNIMDAKNELEGELRKYVKVRLDENPTYLIDEVSINASVGFSSKNSLNELIADGIVKNEKIVDSRLRSLIMEVLGYDENN